MTERRAMSLYRDLGRCRLCWRVTVVVFVAILCVEVAILVFSARKFERDRLADLEQRGLAAASALFLTHPYPMDNELLLATASLLTTGSPVVGGAFYTADGVEVGVFGETPGLFPPTDAEAPPGGAVRHEGGRYEVLWPSARTGAPYVMAARLDSTGIAAQVTAFVYRVVGLVVLISVFVTAVTMVILGATVLGPIVRLRARVVAAGEDPNTPDALALTVDRKDELGDVMGAFNTMIDRLARYSAEIRENEAALEQASQRLEGEVAERTAAHARANEALMREIEERKTAAAEISRLAKIPEEDPSPVLRVAVDSSVLYANAPARALLGLWQITLGDRLPPPWDQTVDGVLRSGEAGEFELTAGERIFNLTFQPLAAAGYVNIYGRDITEGKKAEERLRHSANHDVLTGLPNRALFLDRMEQALLRARRSAAMVAVHVLDLDHFKDVNDTMGHAAGDALIQGVAQRLTHCVRESDTVGRLGGDEFGIIQVDPSGPEGMATLAQKVVNSLARPLFIEGQNVHTGVSIGVSVYPDDTEEPEQIMRNSDMALYQAKGEGRGTYRFFVARMNEEAQRRRAIEADLRAAIDRAEFVLHYQPKLNIKTGRVTGMEALIRWQHPEHGFCSPAEFIPVAERSKLIVPIGSWVLKEACERNKAWQDAGLSAVTVAVNLSAVQFRERNLIDEVRRTLDDSGLEGRFLELEITEGVAMDDAEETIRLFSALSELGLSLSIDDFGTGYSSLSYLKNFPVQRIKIDKAFVDDIGTDENSGAIARAVTMLGQSFGMEVTAEGVETEEQLEFLKDLGCDEIQGYLFSRPLDADAFQSFLDEYTETEDSVCKFGRRG